MNKKIYVEAGGCNRRQLDIKTIRKYLELNGYVLVDRPENADRILVSTCAFKEKEERESVNRLRFLEKYGVDILVYGCLPDIAPERYKEFLDIPKIAPKEIHTIDEHFGSIRVPYQKVAEANLIGKRDGSFFTSVKRKMETGLVLDHYLWEQLKSTGRKLLKERFCKPAKSWFLFICRGCMGKCSYCAIRNSVGTVRSKPIGRILGEFQAGLGKGYHDFSLLGDDPGCYGLDIQSTFPDLLRELFAADSRPEADEEAHDGTRFHIKEIHPKFLIHYTDAFLEMERFDSVKSILCPVQSGSDRILGLMQREHTGRMVKESVLKIKRRHPDILFETQIIIGFPSETREDFYSTLELVKDSGFNAVVVFPYHEKTGTMSVKIAEKVPEKIIRRRMKEAFQYFGRAGIGAYYNCP